MAGHSKWSQIKRQKAITDGKRGAVFTKLGKGITIAVRTGGGDNPDYNFKLKAAIDKAKAARMPKDNIERAIEKGAGKGGEAELKEVVYEGYLPGGVAVMVFGATDNNNRTSGDVRTAFSKAGGALGTSGSVAFMFEKKGITRIIKPEIFDGVLEEKVMELATDAGYEDIDFGEEEILLTVNPHDIEKISKEFETLVETNRVNLEIESSQEEYLPLNTVTVSDPEMIKAIIKAMDTFEDHDDIIEVVSNFEISEPA